MESQLQEAGADLDAQGKPGASMPSFPPKKHLSSTTYPTQGPVVHMPWEPISLQCQVLLDE